jgi:hypothetical protein
MNFIRVPSRFTILDVLGLALLAGIGLDRLVARWMPNRHLVATTVTCLLLVGEFAAIPLPAVPYEIDIPAADRWLATRLGPFAIAEVPVTRSERYHSTYMLHSMAHWERTVHGYSGIRPSLHEALYDELRSFPDDSSLRHLTALGVRYVVVHRSWFPMDQRAALDDGLRQFAPWLTEEYSDMDSRVYSLHEPFGGPEKR